MVPERLDELTGEERHQVYCMLRLQVFVYPNGDLEVRGVLREAVCTPMDTRWNAQVPGRPPLRHQSLLGQALLKAR